MILSLDERLNQILPRITSRDFLDSKGLGNEIGFWVFDYPPEREMDVRNFLSGTVFSALTKHVPPIKAATVDLLSLVTELLEERNLLDKAMKMQTSKGNDSTLAALRSVLKEDKLAQKIAANFECDSASVMEVLMDAETLKKFNVNNNTLMTIVIPNTYSLLWNSPAKKIIDKLYNLMYIL